MRDTLDGVSLLFLETVLEGGEDGAGADIEEVFWAGKCAVGHVFIASFI